MGKLLAFSRGLGALVPGGNLGGLLTFALRRKQRQLDAVVNPELPKNPTEIIFNRLFRKTQLVGNYTVADALFDILADLRFTFIQSLLHACTIHNYVPRNCAGATLF